jgi:broad specificity phosphatase PhoE
MYFIRHSEKLDFIDEDKWKKSARHDENKYDCPLSDNGVSIAEKFIKKFISTLHIEKGVINKSKSVDIVDKIVLYSSPLTRCVQTTLVFQKYIHNKYDIMIPIKIEYGLIEIGHDLCSIDNLEFNKGCLQQKNVLLPIDKKLETKNIFKLYGKANFDTKYKSIMSVKDTRTNKMIIEQYNECISFLHKLARSINNNKINIFVTSGALMNLLIAATKSEMKNHMKEYLGWCMIVKATYNKNKNKYIINDIVKGL